MSIVLRKSSFGSDLFEVWENGSAAEEITIAFPIRLFSFSSREEMHRYLEEREWKLARLASIRILARQSLPTVLFRKKMAQRKFSSKVIEKALSEFSSYFQDDEYLERFILREFNRGHGPRYIEMKLKSKGLKSENVRSLITPEMQREKIASLLPKLKNKQALYRRGFDIEIFS